MILDTDIGPMAGTTKSGNVVQTGLVLESGPDVTVGTCALRPPDALHAKSCLEIPS
jgi:hypothetical protein